MKIIVVIPAKNRENTIERAINSVFLQKGYFNIEIIVVDDASTDDTVLKVHELMQKHSDIFLIQNKQSVGGAAARNIGAKQAVGDYIAFLDSDDEWLENHLQKKIELIKTSNAEGAFGAFNIVRGTKLRVLNFAQFKNMDMAAYIFEKGGDARTSTFVFQKDAFMQVMFDDDLGKHQDWDLAIRFDKKFKMVFDDQRNVNMYVDGGNRMSNKNNYNASEYFLNKHKEGLSNQALYNFKLNICFNAFRTEGNSNNFKKGMNDLKALGMKSDVVHRKKYKLLSNPFYRVLLPLAFYLRRNFQ